MSGYMLKPIVLIKQIVYVLCTCLSPARVGWVQNWIKNLKRKPSVWLQKYDEIKNFLNTCICLFIVINTDFITFWTWLMINFKIYWYILLIEA